MIIRGWKDLLGYVTPNVLINPTIKTNWVTLRRWLIFIVLLFILYWWSILIWIIHVLEWWINIRCRQWTLTSRAKHYINLWLVPTLVRSSMLSFKMLQLLFFECEFMFKFLYLIDRIELFYYTLAVQGSANTINCTTTMWCKVTHLQIEVLCYLVFGFILLYFLLILILFFLPRRYTSSSEV